MTDLFNQETLPDFHGSNYSRKEDCIRLTGQLETIYNLMKDGKWRTLNEIEAVTGYNGASISAQLRNLRKERFGSYTIEKRSRGERSTGLYEYKLTLPLSETKFSDLIK